MQARKPIFKSINPYWDGISAFSEETQIENFSIESIKRYGVIQTIIMEENRLFASRESEDIKEIEESKDIAPSRLWNFILSRKWTDLVSGSFPLSIPEVALKFVGAIFVDLNVAAKKKATDPETSGLWYIPWVLTSLTNAFVAQPLFFVANMLLHTRALLDGAATFVKGFFTADTTAMVRGIKGFARGVACLAIDALAIGVAIGAAILCSLAFQPHLAAGIMPALVGAQSAIMGAVSTPALAAVATTTAVATSLSATANQTVTHTSISSTRALANAFSAQKGMVTAVNEDQNDKQDALETTVRVRRSNQTLVETIRTSEFGFYPSELTRLSQAEEEEPLNATTRRSP